MIVQLSRQAESDLVDILDYVAEAASPEIAVALIERLQARCRSLDRLAERGRTVGAEGGEDAVRRVLKHPYVILYRVTAHRVEVITVQHGSRDLDGVLDDLRRRGHLG